MIDNTINNETAPTEPMQPLQPASVSPSPVPALVPLATWTWNTPVIPTFYWNVYSAEQRIRQICLEIGRIEAWCDYATANANTAHAHLTKRIDELTKQLNDEVARLDARIDEENKARKEADDLLQKGLDAETARAKAAENALDGRIDATNTKLDAEINRSTTEDKRLNDALVEEIRQRKTADSTLQSNIDANKVASDEADKRLQDSIDTEIANRKNGDTALGERIDTESKTRSDADTKLGSRIDVETKTRTDADTALTKRIDATDTNLATESKTRETADNTLQKNIDANKNTSDAADKRLQDSIDTEIANRKNGDNALGERIDTEITSRTDADTALGKRIDTEADTRGNADTALGARIDVEAKARGDADKTLTVEVSKRPTADHITAAKDSHITVTSNTSETDASQTSVVIGDTFTPAFDDLETKLKAETVRATGAEENLSGRITHETADRETADKTLTEEVNKRLKYDGIIEGSHIKVAPDPDKTTVTIATTGLATSESVKQETIDRKNADNALTTEVNKRLKTDSLIAGTNITLVPDTAKNTVTINATGGASTDALANETKARTDADNALGTRIDNESEIRRKTDENLQTAVNGKLSSVTHDATLTGNGTTASKLGACLKNGATPMHDSGTNAAYAQLLYTESADKPTGIGVKAGDGLVAYNDFSDPDVGGGIKLSDATLQTLTNCYTSSKTIVPADNHKDLITTGRVGNELQINVHFAYTYFAFTEAKAHTYNAGAYITNEFPAPKGSIAIIGTGVTIIPKGSSSGAYKKLTNSVTVVSTNDAEFTDSARITLTVHNPTDAAITLGDGSVYRVFVFYATAD